MKKTNQKKAISSSDVKRSGILISVETKYHLAVSAFQQGRLEESKILLKEVLSFDTKHAESLYLSALIKDHEGLYQSSIDLLEKALEIDAQNLKYLYALGDIYYAHNYLNEGIKLFEFIITLKPKDSNGFYNLAVFLQKQKLFQDSLKNYQIVLDLDGDNINAIYNIGNILLDTKDYINAYEYFKRVIEIQPNSDDALNNLGFLQLELGDQNKALEYLNKSLSINPNNFSALNNIGKVYEAKFLYSEALQYFNKAIELNPSYAEAYSNRGVALKELKMYEASLIDFKNAIALDFENPEASYNKSILLLQLQHFSAGWELYRSRWGIKNHFSKKLETDIPDWDGRADSKQLKLLLWAEQGIGDEVFYFGMLKNFFDIDASVTVAADTRLHDLFKRSKPDVEFIDSKQTVHLADKMKFDFQAPIGDIGHLCSVAKSLEHQLPKPFLIANNQKCIDFKSKNPFHSEKFVCGVSWKSTNKDIGTIKSLNLIDLSPLLSIQNVEFVSLQYGSTADEIELVEKSIGRKIHTIGDLDIFNDIDGLTSLISNCDCVVTTSNITAHLTGAIGKKGMVLMPYSKGKIWYWHSGEGQSLWYPSLELVSQSQMNDWTDPITRCKEWVLQQL